MRDLNPPTAFNSESGDASLAGHLLLAHPSLRNREFRRTAILLSLHNSEGAMGVVLNRPLDKRLRDIGSEFTTGPLADVPVFDGGPVAKRQIILCAWRPLKTSFTTVNFEAADVTANEEGHQLLFGLDRERATALVEEEGVQLRAFLGYSGWTSGQLENELKQATWVVADLDADIIHQPADETMWRQVLSGVNAHWCLLAREPEEPERN
jgi:putative transcriptional regulator